MITIPLTTEGASLVLSDAVVERFALHQQVHRDQAEAGGQLFARITRYEIFVEEATGPRPTDRRGRTHYTPDRQAERKEIRERFVLGLHYVGDWHTHPESVPTPSPVDRFTISDCSRRSTHKLAGFLLVVVGNGDFPQCLHISLNHGFEATLLSKTHQSGSNTTLSLELNGSHSQQSFSTDRPLPPKPTNRHRSIRR